MIQWTPARLSSFTAEIERARKRRERVKEAYGWDDNLERYVPLGTKGDDGSLTYDVNVGADFRDVERKKAALFYDTPAVSFVPDNASAPLGPPPQPPQPGQPPPPPPPTLGSIVALHQRLINGLLGHRYAGAKRVVLQTLFDVLCPSGVGLVKVGYDVATVDVEQPALDPTTGQPVLDELGQPTMQPTKLPIHEDWYLAHLSPYSYLVPADHRDTEVKAAPWVGYDFEWPLSEVRRRFGLPPEWKPQGGKGGGSSDEDRPYFKDDALTPAGDSESEPMVSGCYVEYHPAQLAQEGDPPSHPLQIAELVLIDGHDAPVVDRPSPHQTIGDDARLTPDSITRYTIVPLTLRDRTDQAFPASDCTVTAALTAELNTYRTTIVKTRDANVPVTFYDSERMNPEVRDKLKAARRIGDVGALIPVEGGALDNGIDKIVAQVTQVNTGREAWTGQDYIERDREQILGIGSNQAGVTSKSSRTATEVSTVQRNTEARFEQERQRVLEWYLDLVCLFDLMVLRYADARTASKILGPEAAQAWAQFKPALAGAYRYEIQIDSGKYLDIEANKRQWLQLLNMVGQSPHVNAVPILKKIAQAHGMDPSEVVIDQPPKKGPEPPKVSITIPADNFNPALPQFPIVVELARQGGFQISDQAVQQAQEQATRQAMVASMVAPQADTAVSPEPPQVTQTLPKMPTLNQHQSEESGGMPGPGPM